MVVIVFLVDTSASMNQKTAHGTSYLDIAKNGIFAFLKYRGREASVDPDRYMLVTLDDPPSSIKVGRTSSYLFTTELKNLHAKGISSLSQGLKDSLDLLNVQRLQIGIDQYGQGRSPFILEPAVIIAITDGGKSMKNGNSNNWEMEDEVLFPQSGHNGSELTKEMFRWDQRLFTVLLRMPGITTTADTNITDTTYDHFSSLCEYTGGKCYNATNPKSIYQIMESISQKMIPGVVLNFRKIGSEVVDNSFHGWKTRTDSHSKENTPLLTRSNSNGQSEEGNTREVSPPDSKGTNWHNLRKMIYVRSKSWYVTPSGHWPIPESYWPELFNGTLPPRDVHPVVWFDDKDVPPMLLESFAFDKYELEPSPLTQQLLAKRNPNICWEVFINDSGKERGLSHPFGYLKSSSSGNFVNLFVMPFNYRKLIPLIEELQRQRLKPSSKWRSDFAGYISTLPSYYAQPLRKSLQLMGAHPGLVPETFDGSMSYTITNYLRKLKKQSEMDTNELANQEISSSKKSSKITEVNGISVAIGSTEVERLSSQSYRNPFDISRLSLLEQVSRMRTNFLHSSANTPHLIEEVDKHQVPISRMGNYQQHLKELSPLRELDTGAVKTQLFGNPFRLEKASSKMNMADEMMVEHMKRPGSPAREPHRSKRRHSRSPTPSHPPPVVPPVDQRKATPNDTPIVPSKEEKLSNHHRNMSSNIVPLPHKSTSSSKDIKTQEHSKSAILDGEVSSLEKSGNGQVLSDTNNRGDHPNPPAPEKQRDKLVQVNRKRSPSPTSLPPPNPKRSNKEHFRTETVAKISNDKLPSPSPLLAPMRQTGLSSASQVLNEEFKRKQNMVNLKLKQSICKEIRKNSKSYEAIFQNLESVQGSVDAKRSFVKEIIREAERFRKKQLIQYLEDWMSKLSSGNKPETVKSVKNNNKLTSGHR